MCCHAPSLTLQRIGNLLDVGAGGKRKQPEPQQQPETDSEEDDAWGSEEGEEGVSSEGGVDRALWAGRAMRGMPRVAGNPQPHVC